MTRFAANLSFLFTEHPFEDRFAAAAQAGFAAVEFLFPYEHKPETIRQLADDAGVKVVLFNAPPGNWAGGERGIACLAGREGEFNEGIEQAAQYARALGCPRIHVLAGVTPKGARRELYSNTFLQNIKTAASHFSLHGVEALIEPINPIDMPGYLINLPEDAAEIIESDGMNNVFMQFDLYHGAMQNVDLMGAVWRYMPIIHHFQVAGCPDRGEPNSGNVDYSPIFKLIKQMDFDGWVGCEYKPKTDTLAGLSWIDELD
ncbi:MAG: TIM barrel protein [Rhodospirillaceae bacterium]|nr:TIM barrel protein [Rhodospirillaceae bacterium]